MSSGFHSCSIACFLCTVLPSQTSVMVCADSPMLLNCFGKAVFKLPLSKKESFRRQEVFRVILVDLANATTPLKARP